MGQKRKKKKDGDNGNDTLSEKDFICGGKETTQKRLLQRVKELKNKYERI
jgi:hypothetical protein